VNKELGIFRNMMHHAALNYDLSGISASTKTNGVASGKNLSKVTTGSVTWVTNLNLLVGPSALAVDYLIITHSSLFNSSSLATLANHRRDFNGYDVVICQVDASGSNNDIYDFEDTPGHIKYPSTTTTRYVSIRDFIKDVYANGKANHIGDGHLGYIMLVGDALQDNNSTVMLPASYFYHQSIYTPPSTGIPDTLDLAADYYYACTGGDTDNLMDLMYGRLPVGNETELSNNVNKIISYEHNTNGSWVNKCTFVSFSPDLWYYWDSDNAMKVLTEIVPPTYQKSYAYRAYDTDPSTVVTEANPRFGQRFRPGQYDSAQYLCGADLLDNWVYDDADAGINNGIHTFVYEGHAGPFGFGAEGCGRGIFGLEGHSCSGSYISNRLHNDLYSFMMFVCCESGYFDHHSDDCEAEVFVNKFADRGAIGVLASTRSSWSNAFGVVDGGVLAAMHGSLSHVMGEAIMESKLSMPGYGDYLLFRRQYNLYGDPAVNLWPTGYTISENQTLSGTVQISSNMTVASGTTLTISEGATLMFADGVSLTVNGVLNANGSASQPITFKPVSGTTTGSWGPIILNGSGGSHLNHVNMQYGTEINVASVPSFTIENCSISNSINGINCSYQATGTISDNTISYPRDHGIVIGNGSIVTCTSNTLEKSDQSGAGTYYGGGSHGSFRHNQITGFNWGVGSIWGSTPDFYNPDWAPTNNHIMNCLAGLEVYYYSSIQLEQQSYEYNGIHANSLNVEVWGTSDVYANYNHWGWPVNAAKFSKDGSSTLSRSYAQKYCPWCDGQQQSPREPSTQYAHLKFSDPQQSVENGVPTLSALEIGKRLKDQKQYAEALKYFSNMVQRNEDAVPAILEMYTIDDDAMRGDVITALNALPSTAPLISKHLLSVLYLKNGDVASAKKMSSEIVASHPNSVDARHAVLQLFNIAIYEENDLASAKDLLGSLATNKEAADDIDISLAQRALQTATAIGGFKASSGATIAREKKILAGSATSTTPSEYALLQNYPNPFNPTTTLAFELPEPSQVVLTVYDYIGREVSTVVNSYRSAGRYEVWFDASKLGSGVYFYKLQAGRYTAVKKMLLVK
jgi:tetratricopeptide (TPR) repeat protein